MARFQARAEVASLNAVGDQWLLRDKRGHVLGQAGVVVLANAIDAQRLWGEPLACLHAVRGQTTQVPLTAPGLHPPLVPITGAGYVLPSMAGGVLCGATAQRDDSFPALRVTDHQQNLAQLARLTGSLPRVDCTSLQGFVGWRCVVDDRLPVIGAVPDSQALRNPGLRLDQPRFVPRAQGLFVFTALGSRGVTWAALGAQTLASMISGAPCPLQARLLDAVDVARFTSRTARRMQRAGSTSTLAA